MQSLILSPLRLATNSLLILVAWDWGQAAIWLVGGALGLAAIPELGKATHSHSCPNVLKVMFQSWSEQCSFVIWESSVSGSCSSVSG